MELLLNTPDSVFSLLGIMVAVEVFLCFTGYDLVDKIRNRIYVYYETFPQIKSYVKKEISPLVTKVEENINFSYKIMCTYLLLTTSRVFIVGFSFILNFITVIDSILFALLIVLLIYILYIFITLFGQIDKKIKTINHYLEYPF
jgi:hypothetical protein